MTDQSQRLEVATMKAEVGSNILYRFANDPAANAEIPTGAGDIPNLKQVILQLQEEGAEKISFATTIYPTTAAGIAATANGAVFLVVSNEAGEIYAVYTNSAGVAVDTGKRALSSQAVEDAMQAATEAADAAQEAADLSTERTARFLAPVSAPPVIRDDGTPLQIGDRYINTVSQVEYIYKTSGWAANDSMAAIADLEDPADYAKGAALVPYDGTTVGEQILASRKLSDFDAARAYNGNASKIEVAKAGISGTFFRRPFLAGDVDDGGDTLVSNNGLWTMRRDFKGAVFPLWFGAVGDGVSNDTEAVRAACALATELGLEVSFAGMARTYIDTNADIRFNCSLRGHGTTLVSADGIITPPSNSSIKNMFRLVDPDLSQRPISINVAELYDGQTQLTVPENVGNGMLYVSSNKQIGSRTSDPTTPLYFAISHSIYRGGVLNYPIKTDLTANTITALFTPSPQTWVEIDGFTADETSYNNQCLFRVERGLTRVKNIAIQPNGRNTMPLNVNYLFRFVNSVNVVVEDCIINGQSTYGGNTYGIVFDNCCDITMSRMYGRGRDTWGVMETNNVNGVVINDCSLNRLDVHQGMHNFFVNGGVCYGNAVQYGWGSGLLVVDGLNVIGNTSVVAARPDYDGNFDGEIQILNPNVNYMRQTADSNGVALLVALFQANSVGGAFPVKVCESLVISNACCIHAGAAEVILTQPFNVALAPGAVAVSLPNYISIDRVYSPKGRIGFTMDMKFELFKPNASGKVRIEVSNISARPYRVKATLNRSVNPNTYQTPSGTFELEFRNVTGYTQYCGMPGAKIFLQGCEISHIKTFVGGSSAQRLSINDSDITETTAANGGTTLGEIGAASDEITLNNVKVRSACDLSQVDASQGLLMIPGVAATLPAGAAISTMFSGWKSTTFQ